MKHATSIFTVLLVSVAAVVSAQEKNEDEAAIRQAIDSYVKAFNQGDANALAAHWTEQGLFLTPAGRYCPLAPSGGEGIACY